MIVLNETTVKKSDQILEIIINLQILKRIECVEGKNQYVQMQKSALGIRIVKILEIKKPPREKRS